LLGGGGIHSQTWDVTSGQPLGSPLQTSLPAVTLAFSPDGQRLVMTRQTRLPGWNHDTDREAAHFWLVDRGTGELLVPPLHQGDGVSGATFSPDGKIIATGGKGGSLMLWDAATGRRLGPALQHPAEVTAAAFHPSGTWLATGCVDGIIRFWDVPAPATGDSERIRQWVQARTASEMDTKGRMRPLTPEALHTLRRDLEATGDEPFPPPIGAKP
jgi:WD40 repeat protein